MTMPAGWLRPNGAHGRRAKQILRADAFEYHRKARPGKIAIAVTSPAPRSATCPLRMRRASPAYNSQRPGRNHHRCRNGEPNRDRRVPLARLPVGERTIMWRATNMIERPTAPACIYLEKSCCAIWRLTFRLVGSKFPWIPLALRKGPVIHLH